MYVYVSCLCVGTNVKSTTATTIFVKSFQNLEGGWVRNSEDKFDGQVPRVNGPILYIKTGEKLQFMPMDNVSAYFLTTDKAIITKLRQNIKQIEPLYKTVKYGDKSGMA